MLFTRELITETAKAAFNFRKVKKTDVPPGFKKLADGFKKSIEKEVRDRYKIKDKGNCYSFTVFMPVPFDRVVDGRVPKYYKEFTDTLFKSAGMKKSKERINWIDNIVDNMYYYYKKAKTKDKEDCYFIAHIDMQSVSTQSVQSDGFSYDMRGTDNRGIVAHYKDADKVAVLYFELKCIVANNKTEKILEGSNWYAL